MSYRTKNRILKVPTRVGLSSTFLYSNIQISFEKSKIINRKNFVFLKKVVPSWMDLTYHLYLPMGRSAKDEYREASSSHNQDLQVFKFVYITFD